MKAQPQWDFDGLLAFLNKLHKDDVAAAKRELAEKMLAAIDGERLHEDLDNEGDKGYMQAIEDVTNAVRKVFTESGVAVEKEG